VAVRRHNHHGFFTALDELFEPRDNGLARALEQLDARVQPTENPAPAAVRGQFLRGGLSLVDLLVGGQELSVISAQKFQPLLAA
jgi:hypothetical protein